MLSSLPQITVAGIGTCTLVRELYKQVNGVCSLYHLTGEVYECVKKLRGGKSTIHIFVLKLHWTKNVVNQNNIQTQQQISWSTVTAKTADTHSCKYPIKNRTLTAKLFSNSYMTHNT